MTDIRNTINYIEFPLKDGEATKDFYNAVFGWEFTDWGPDYISFTGAAVEGGFNGEAGIKAHSPGILVVLYTDKITEKLDDIVQAGGEIIKPVYDFPGGRRFHFCDPNGNELAVWSEK